MCNQITHTRSSIISQPFPSCNRDCGFFAESKTLNPKRKIHSHVWATSSSVGEYGSLLKPEGWVCSTRALPDRSSSFKVLKVTESKSLQTDFEITSSYTASLKLYSWDLEIDNHGGKKNRVEEFDTNLMQEVILLCRRHKIGDVVNGRQWAHRKRSQHRLLRFLLTMFRSLRDDPVLHN